MARKYYRTNQIKLDGHEELMHEQFGTDHVVMTTNGLGAYRIIIKVNGNRNYRQVLHTHDPFEAEETFDRHVKEVTMREAEEHIPEEELASDDEEVVSGVRPPTGYEEEDWEPKPTS